MKRRLDKKWYDLLKNMDYSLMEISISFNDEEFIFECNDKNFDVIFDLNIAAHGMDEKQNQCNEYGRQLYELYDLLFFSDYGVIEE